MVTEEFILTVGVKWECAQALMKGNLATAIKILHVYIILPRYTFLVVHSSETLALHWAIIYNTEKLETN